MADYKELLRRAVEALPENNGAARRAVYEKARAALVGQLRAINPPLPARDITTHRLQLEDCIRQVEQEASEANIAGIGVEPAAPPTLPPVFAAESKSVAKPAPKAAEPAKPAPKAANEPAVRPKPETAKPAARPNGKANGAVPTSIEDIIAAAEHDRAPMTPPPAANKAPELKSRPPKSQPVLVAKSEPPARDQLKTGDKRGGPAKPEGGRPLPSIVARAEAAKGRAAPSLSVAADNPRRPATIEPRRNSGAVAARQVDPLEYNPPEDVAAMAAVREVEVEQPADPQGAIDRAIATLDREARGDARAQYADSEVELDDEPMTAPPKKNGFFNGRAADMPVLKGEQREFKAPRPAREFANPRRSSNRAFPDGMPRAQAERGGLGAVTIFLIIFVVLLVGAGGAGFWAYNEGFINLDAMFGKGTPAVTTAAASTPLVTPDSTGPGNTETVAAAEPSTQLKANERLPSASPAPASDTASVAPLALQSPAAADGKAEERLSGSTEAPQSAQDATVAAIDPASVAGSQSLLLEASDNGTTGAVPFSGTVDWMKGTDENGLPTLFGKANIPARNLSVDLLIRKNSDPSLPASHLMEINFTVSDSFIGGSIAGLPGVLLKDEELVQGTPLVGASARVVGNSFLFALSAAPEDSTANVNLLTSRKWMDLALIYASGKRAIITLEKDDKAQKLFSDVFAAWSKSTAKAG
jgi:hypothetical protein